MKTTYKIIALLLLTTFVSSCKEEDEGKLPDITFKTGGSYVSTSKTVAQGAEVVIGIEAQKTEEEDVLTKFNVSRSIDGGTASTVVTENLSGSDADKFNYDFTTVMDSVSGQKNEYTFTVTNRDGLINQVRLSLTVE